MFIELTHPTSKTDLSIPISVFEIKEFVVCYGKPEGRP